MSFKKPLEHLPPHNGSISSNNIKHRNDNSQYKPSSHLQNQSDHLDNDRLTQRLYYLSKQSEMLSRDLHSKTGSDFDLTVQLLNQISQEQKAILEILHKTTGYETRTSNPYGSFVLPMNGPRPVDVKLVAKHQEEVLDSKHVINKLDSQKMINYPTHISDQGERRESRSTRWINADIHPQEIRSVKQVQVGSNPELFIHQEQNHSIDNQNSLQEKSQNYKDIPYTEVYKNIDNKVNDNQSLQEKLQNVVDNRNFDKKHLNDKNIEYLVDNFSDLFSNVQFNLHNYEVFINDKGEKEVRYKENSNLNKQGDHHRTNSRSLPDYANTNNISSNEYGLRMQSEKISQERNRLSSNREILKIRGSEFQQTPYEYNLHDKHGNPVTVYTAMDDEGHPVQIINVFVGEAEIQYVSYINENGVQELKKLDDFMKEYQGIENNLNDNINQNFNQSQVNQRNTGISHRHLDRVSENILHEQVRILERKDNEDSVKYDNEIDVNNSKLSKQNQDNMTNASGNRRIEFKTELPAQRATEFQNRSQYAENNKVSNRQTEPISANYHAKYHANESYKNENDHVIQAQIDNTYINHANIVVSTGQVDINKGVHEVNAPDHNQNVNTDTKAPVFNDPNDNKIKGEHGSLYNFGNNNNYTERISYRSEKIGQTTRYIMDETKNAHHSKNELINNNTSQVDKRTSEHHISLANDNNDLLNGQQHKVNILVSENTKRYNLTDSKEPRIQQNVISNRQSEPNQRNVEVVPQNRLTDYMSNNNNNTFNSHLNSNNSLRHESFKKISNPMNVIVDQQIDVQSNNQYIENVKERRTQNQGSQRNVLTESNNHQLTEQQEVVNNKGPSENCDIISTEYLKIDNNHLKHENGELSSRSLNENLNSQQGENYSFAYSAVNRLAHEDKSVVKLAVNNMNEISHRMEDLSHLAEKIVKNQNLATIYENSQITEDYEQRTLNEEINQQKSVQSEQNYIDIHQVNDDHKNHNEHDENDENQKDKIIKKLKKRMNKVNEYLDQLAEIDPQGYEELEKNYESEIKAKMLMRKSMNVTDTSLMKTTEKLNIEAEDDNKKMNVSEFNKTDELDDIVHKTNTSEVQEINTSRTQHEQNQHFISNNLEEAHKEHHIITNNNVEIKNEVNYSSQNNSMRNTITDYLIDRTGLYDRERHVVTANVNGLRVTRKSREIQPRSTSFTRRIYTQVYQTDNGRKITQESEYGNIRSGGFNGFAQQNDYKVTRIVEPNKNTDISKDNNGNYITRSNVESHVLLSRIDP